MKSERFGERAPFKHTNKRIDFSCRGLIPAILVSNSGEILKPAADISPVFGRRDCELVLGNVSDVRR
jgi:hypothetical protein